MELLELVIEGAEAQVSLMAALALKFATAEHTITNRNSSGLLQRSNCGMSAVTLSGRTYRRTSRLVLYAHPGIATVIQTVKHSLQFYYSCDLVLQAETSKILIANKRLRNFFCKMTLL
jgi:hypothetical protein